MKACGFDKAFVDKIGNAVGVAGSGKPVLLFDAHMDTVGIHDRSRWKVDPYKGKIDGRYVYGRGAAENKGALAAILYGCAGLVAWALPGARSPAG